MKTWREHMFFGKLCRTFLVQTCEGQGEKIIRGCWQIVVNFRNKIERKGNIEVIFKVLYIWEYITVTTVGWWNIIFSERHSPPAYLSPEFDRSRHLYSAPFVSHSLFVYFVLFSLHHLHKGYSLFSKSLWGFSHGTHWYLFWVYMRKQLLSGRC